MPGAVALITGASAGQRGKFARQLAIDLGEAGASERLLPRSVVRRIAGSLKL